MYKKQNLNGFWQFQPGLEKPVMFMHSVPVPAMVDNCVPSFNWQQYDFFWYKTEFELPNDSSAKNIFLQLEQVQFGTEVWINDKKLGGDIPCYTSQWFDLTQYINKIGSNTLLVRVGQKHTLPEHSAVGNDQERLAWIPGIWGDVNLHLYGAGRITFAQIIPDINKSSVSIECELENFEKTHNNFIVKWQIVEKNSGNPVTKKYQQNLDNKAKGFFTYQSQVSMDKFNLWSPENPFLYELQISVTDSDGDVAHQKNIPFGMRNFEIRDAHFFLNNKRRVLMGSNIAFHRLLNDSSRGTLLWDEAWIKKAFIDIPKQHNLNFFRFHLGHAYNRWYDLADEHGIMLEDEWGFWTSSGSIEQTEKEFTSWLKENCNRPSIVIWNALNESSDSKITEEIIPRLKKIDPTRPWQHVDFAEDHPYIYSLGPVLNGKKFGFSRSIFDLQKSKLPSMVNEFEWWWLDRDNNPSKLTEIVIERWLGRKPPKQMLVEHQAFLAAELGELWRRLDLDAIMPFVYLSVGEGATANWFDGPLEHLQAKPVLAAYKNAFSPLGISIELWDRHFVGGEVRTINVYLFNDGQSDEKGVVRIKNKSEPQTIFFEQSFSLQEGMRKIIPFKWHIPEARGSFFLCAELISDDRRPMAYSEKPVHIFNKINMPDSASIPSLLVVDPSMEIQTFLQKNGVLFQNVSGSLDKCQLVLLNLQAIGTLNMDLKERLNQFVEDGGTLILQEPEFGVEHEKHINILTDLKLKIAPQDDSEMGGYNSYVFAEDQGHSLWNGIEAEHLKMFNGALGGEMVSAYDVVPNRDFTTYARCGLSLVVPAVMEIPYGKGKIIISRIQIRGRLSKKEMPVELYDRRYDPVAEQYLRNLLSAWK